MRCDECGTHVSDDAVLAPSPLEGAYCPECAEMLASELLERAGEVVRARRAEQLAELEKSRNNAGEER